MTDLVVGKQYVILPVVENPIAASVLSPDDDIHARPRCIDTAGAALVPDQ
jgi:hypothetical protein